MTEKDLFREIGNINEKYVTEAQEVKRPVILTPAFRRTLATAACLVVCLVIYVGVQQVRDGAKSESATMQAETNGTASTNSSMKTESVVMDTADTQYSATAGETNSEGVSEESFWEGLWPSDKEMASDCAPQEEAMQEASGAVSMETEKIETDKAETNKTEDVEAFLEASVNGEEAILELVRVLEDDTCVCATLRYTGAGVYEWTPWHMPTYEQEDAEVPAPIEYEYLKMFEEISETGKVYCIIGLGEKEDFTLYDLQNGSEGTCFILKYEK